MIEAGARSGHVRGVTAHPDGAQTSQQARNLLMDLGERAARFQFLVPDRAGQFTGACGAVLPGAGIEVVKIPPRSPRANAHAERWVRTVRAEVTDRMLLIGPRHLRAIPGNTSHDHQRRPRRARDPRPPGTVEGAPAVIAGLTTAKIRRSSVLGWLINEYERTA